MEGEKKDGGEADRGLEMSSYARSLYEQEQVAKFLATASVDGTPNVALIVSQMPVEDGRLIFGEFMMVKTLSNLRENPRVASLVLTPKLEMAGLKAVVEGWTESGPYVDRINSIPFFRYNAYAGIHNVAVARVTRLVEMKPRVPFAGVGLDFALMRASGSFSGPGVGAEIPVAIASKLNGVMSIKALAFMDDDGYPGVLPVFGVRLRRPGEVRFKVSSYNERLQDLRTPCPVAVNVLTMDLLTYQVKGELLRFERSMGVNTGVVRVDEAYSCVPPFCGERVV